MVVFSFMVVTADVCIEGQTKCNNNALMICDAGDFQQEEDCSLGCFTDDVAKESYCGECSTGQNDCKREGPPQKFELKRKDIYGNTAYKSVGSNTRIYECTNGKMKKTTLCDAKQGMYCDYKLNDFGKITDAKCIQFPRDKVCEYLILSCLGNAMQMSCHEYGGFNLLKDQGEWFYYEPPRLCDGGGCYTIDNRRAACGEAIFFTSKNTHKSFSGIKEVIIKEAPQGLLCNAGEEIAGCCITKKQEGEKVTLQYNPLCQMCGDKSLATIELPLSGETVAKRKLDIFIPCKADVMLVTNTNFIKKDVINAAAQFKEVEKNKLAGKQYPVYDSILLNWIDVQAKEGRTVRYVEANNEDARKTFGYEFGTINADITTTTEKFTKEIPSNARNIVSYQIGNNEIKLQNVGLKIIEPQWNPFETIPSSTQKVPIIEIRILSDTKEIGKGTIDFVNGERKSFSLYPKAVTTRFQSKDIVFIAKPPKNIEIEYSNIEPLTDIYQHRVNDYKSVFLKVLEKANPTYIILVGDYKVIPSPLMYEDTNDFFPTDDCYVMPNCDWTKFKPSRIIARLPAKQGGDEVLPFILLERATKNRELPNVPSLIGSGDVCSKDGCAANFFPSKKCNEPMCMYAPPYCYYKYSGNAMNCDKNKLETFLSNAHNNILYLEVHGSGTGFYANVKTTDPISSYTIFEVEDMAKWPKNYISPMVISGSCYGGSISDWSTMTGTSKDTTATRFLEKGAIIYVGSTTVAYGSVNLIIASKLYGGSTIGQAVLDLFMHDVTALNPEWYKIQLYGDPTIRIKKT